MPRFTFYQRKRQTDKPVFYVRFKQPDGTWSSGILTHQTSRRKAEDWALDYLEKHKKLLPKKDITFGEYAENFFDWNSPWAVNKRVEGKRLSVSHANSRAEILRNHVLPVFENIKLQQITKTSIRDFRNDLWARGYSGSQINKALCAIRAILQAAEDQELIEAIPKIERAADRPKPKGILSIEEVRRLFAVEWVSDPAYSHPSKPRDMGRVGNMLAASTGLRLGELQALQIRDLRLDDQPPHVIVRRSWDRKTSILNETTKTGRERFVIIPRDMSGELRELIARNPFPGDDSFVFYAKTKSKPAEAPIFVKPLYEALKKIGIGEEHRRARNITFHSWRHWFNSILINARVPLHKVQAMTGHSTLEMSTHYYHARLEDFQEIGTIQETIFSPGPDDPGPDEIH
ncbi:MAG TPA: tyrosine-type recombinase/integrase [Spirochaetota bacterium]|nr:tyrosine-type recombinase/integrase [Spirochaetota bacterium]